jgi:hypothetical protein
MEGKLGLSGYYAELWKEFGAQFYESWKSELRSTVGVAILAFVLSFAHDPSAWEALILTLKAGGIWLLLWAAWHLIRTPWKLQRKSVEIALNKPSESQRVTVEQLTAKVSELQREAENRIPSLHLDVWEVLIVPHLNSVEVFVDASVANSTPNTQGTVRQFKLALEVAGRRFEAQKDRADLDDYRIIDRSDTKTIEPRNFRFTVLDDIAGLMNETNPILHGVPHRGWLHFSFLDLTDWPLGTNKVLSFMPIQTTPKVITHPRVTFGGYWIESSEIGVSIDAVECAIVTIDDYLGSGATFLASVNKTGDHIIVRVY